MFVIPSFYARAWTALTEVGGATAVCGRRSVDHPLALVAGEAVGYGLMLNHLSLLIFHQLETKLGALSQL